MSITRITSASAIGVSPPDSYSLFRVTRHFGSSGCSQLDKLYQQVVQALDRLLQGVGLKAA